jgi:2-oxoglutarate ferredoxin oxidoreductase subunit beta
MSNSPSVSITAKIREIGVHSVIYGLGQMLTGLVYLRPEKKSFISLLNLVDEPLHSLPLERTRPPREALDKIMKELM